MPVLFFIPTTHKAFLGIKPGTNDVSAWFVIARTAKTRVIERFYSIGSIIPLLQFLNKSILCISITLRGLSQITFALRVGRWSEKRVVYYIKTAK